MQMKVSVVEKGDAAKILAWFKSIRIKNMRIYWKES